MINSRTAPLYSAYLAYPEDTQPQQAIEICTKTLIKRGISATIYETTDIYRNTTEKALKIEIINTGRISEFKIRSALFQIKLILRQDVILLTKSTIELARIEG